MSCLMVLDPVQRVFDRSLELALSEEILGRSAECEVLRASEQPHAEVG